MIKKGLRGKKGSEESFEITQKILTLMTKQPNWYSSNFFISDYHLNDKLFPIEKGKIYSIIHRRSGKALEYVHDLMDKEGFDFGEAKYRVKHTYLLPLLKKIRDNPSKGVIGGWQEYSFDSLEMDYRMRLFHHELSAETIRKILEMIEEMRTKLEMERVSQ